MIDPTTLPILIKALDFLFEEGRKILEEKRERRKQTSSVSTENNAHEKSFRFTKDKALTTKIEEAKWEKAKDDINHLMSLLEIYRKNYYLAKEQYATFGSALVPSLILHNLEEAEDGIATTSKKLEDAINNLYIE